MDSPHAQVSVDDGDEGDLKEEQGSYISRSCEFVAKSPTEMMSFVPLVKPIAGVIFCVFPWRKPSEILLRGY